MHMGKGGSVSGKERTAMFEDAPVNTGAVQWPDAGSASVVEGDVVRDKRSFMRRPPAKVNHRRSGL